MIRQGTLSDYQRLSRHHYRCARPATISSVLVDEVAGADGIRWLRGVLVVSMPARFGPWRRRAWPDLEPGIDVLNRSVRAISRVVVDPRWRGMGVGRGLVTAYLAEPLTDRTEVVAAMGGFSPLFEAAGMRRVEWLPSRRVRRLRAVMSAVGLEPWRLADPAGVEAWSERHPREGAELERALRTFARAHGDTRRRAGAPVRELIELGARHAACEPAVYVHERGASEGRG